MPKNDKKQPIPQETSSDEISTQETQAENEVASTAEEMIASLQSELAEADVKAREYLDGWQRSRAEFTNYKKRIEREQSQTYQMAAAAVIRHFLGVVDDLERALKNRPKDGDGATWAEGIELIYRKLLSTLESEGVTRMKAEGEMFDPNFHEAIMSEPSQTHASGQIIEVLQQGYLQGDKVVRPAMVRVAS